MVLGELCFNDDFCKLVEFSKCSTTDFVCICTSNTIAVNQTCKPLLDGFCEKDEECVPDYSVCINNTCKCSSYFLPLLNTQCKEGKCVLIKKFPIMNNLLIFPKII